MHQTGVLHAVSLCFHADDQRLPNHAADSTMIEQENFRRWVKMGIFSRKPSRVEQQKWVAASQRILPLFIQLAKSRKVVFSDGRFVDLEDSDQRLQLLSELELFIMNLHFHELPPCTLSNVVDRAKRIHDLVNATTYKDTGPIVETAHGIVQGINLHEMFCCTYSEQYPHFVPFRDMIHNNVKVMAHALKHLFGDRVAALRSVKFSDVRRPFFEYSR
jgi:hypothetical protein